MRQPAVLTAGALGRVGEVVASGPFRASYRAITETRLRVPGSALCQEPGGDHEALVDQFRQGGVALLGTFWEGVDFLGEQLRALVIARLPFDPPDDPVLKARQARLPNPFWTDSVPRASLRLRQGFGRLIRSTTDSGVCVILDPRARGARYGQLLVSHLPPCSVITGTWESIRPRVTRWLDEHHRTPIRHSGSGIRDSSECRMPDSLA